MKLIEYRNSHDCDVEFQDEFKYVYEHVLYQCFKQGRIKNPYDKTINGVGMLGVGKYMARYNKIKSKAKDYNIWQAILERCYVAKDKSPAYYDISTVCDEWLIFQNFAQWYEENTYTLPDGERLEIDKDILFPCNKEYSPDKCLLVPQRINLLFTNMKRNDGLPNGIQRTNNGKKFMAMYNTKHLGCFETLEEAYEKYAEKKEKAIKERAEEYKKYMPEKVYNALLDYRVKIEYDKNYNVSA